AGEFEHRHVSAHHRRVLERSPYWLRLRSNDCGGKKQTDHSYGGDLPFVKHSDRGRCLGRDKNKCPKVVIAKASALPNLRNHSPKSVKKALCCRRFALLIQPFLRPESAYFWRRSASYWCAISPFWEIYGFGDFLRDSS